MSVGVMKSLHLHNMVHDGGYGYTINDEMIEVIPLDRDLCFELVEECKEKGFPWTFSPEIAPYRLAPDDSFMDFTHDTYLKTIVVDGLDPHDYEKIYKMYIACFHKEEERLDVLKKLPWCRYHDNYLFVEPTDKSKGIEKIIEYFHAPIEDVVVFGDDLTDLSMFDKRWFSIAVGNAKEELKKKADYVTETVLNDGIYKACKKFGWID